MISVSPSGRCAFTAIEMTVVLSIVLMLTAITVPFIIPAITNARVQEAAGMVAHTAEEARLLAIGNSRLERQLEARPGFTPVCFGYRVARAQGTEQAYVVLMGWREAAVGPEELSSRRYFNANVDLWFPAVDQVDYYFSFRTGRPGTLAPPPGNAYTALTVPADIGVGTRDAVWDAPTGKFTKGVGAVVTLYNSIGLTYVH